MIALTFFFVIRAYVSFVELNGDQCNDEFMKTNQCIIHLKKFAEILSENRATNGQTESDS